MASLTGGDKPDASVVAVGLGGAGNDQLTHLIDSGSKNIYCIATDTDRYNLHIAKAHRKLFMQHISCSDSGTKGNPEIGRRAALDASEKLKPVLENADLVFVLAGMGGGTGSGAAPVVSDLARRSGALVVGVITKPFSFEHGRLGTAIDSMRRILNTCDTVILLDNYLSEPSPITLPFGLNPDAAGQTSCSIISSIAEGFINPEHLSVELGQLKVLLKRGGLAKVGVGESYSLGGAEEATLNALRHIMPIGALAQASGVFVNITGHEKIKQSDIEGALGLVSCRINPDSDFLYGRVSHTDIKTVTRVSVLVTGATFPYSWGGYRKLPIELHEMEPESGEEDGLGIHLNLHQLEQFTIHLDL